MQVKQFFAVRLFPDKTSLAGVAYILAALAYRNGQKCYVCTNKDS